MESMPVQQELAQAFSKGFERPSLTGASLACQAKLASGKGPACLKLALSTFLLALSTLCRRPFDLLEPCRPYVVVDLMTVDLCPVDVLPPHQYRCV
jgi:hypothetical protein